MLWDFGGGNGLRFVLHDSSSLSVVDLQFQVRKLRGHIHHLNDQSHVQSSLDQFFVKPTNEDVSMH